jgi:hypothetical protein
MQDGRRVPLDPSQRGQHGFFIRKGKEIDKDGIPNKGIGKGRPFFNDREKVSKGFFGRQFLDAGLRRIAKELPLEYEKTLQTAASRLASKKVERIVTPPVIR